MFQQTDTEVQFRRILNTEHVRKSIYTKLQNIDHEIKTTPLQLRKPEDRKLRIREKKEKQNKSTQLIWKCLNRDW